MLLRAIGLGALLGLGGCTGANAPNLSGLLGGANASPEPQLALLGGKFTAVGPAGYCADTAASRPVKGFAIFAPCGMLGGTGASATLNAVTTVQIGPVNSAIVGDDPRAFAQVLSSDSGPAILSRDGDAQTVVVQSVRQHGARVSVYFTDAAPAFIAGAQEAEWRSFFDLSGRLATVTVRGLDSAPLSATRGAVLLDQAVEKLMLANSPAAVSAR